MNKIMIFIFKNGNISRIVQPIKLKLEWILNSVQVIAYITVDVMGLLLLSGQSKKTLKKKKNYLPTIPIPFHTICPT